MGLQEARFDRITSSERCEPSTRGLQAQIRRLEARLNAFVAENRRLAEKTSLLESVLENMGEGVVAFDASGRVAIANRAARATFGVEAAPEVWRSGRKP